MSNRTIIARRLQAATLSIDAQGNSTTDVSLDGYYDDVESIQVVEVDASGVQDYNIGVEAGGRRIIDPVNAAALQCDRAVGVADRKHPVGFSAKEPVQIVTQVNQAPAGTLKYQVIFHLVKYGEC